ncbi:carbohydrate ABC transporter permease [Kribbella sp. NPDC050459]|uniref:carbohydrate ABC transporter permease n=1 Tax=Kribbella sp. NPDC050459 TaxID=3155785 RepID=UPI00340F32C1
MSDNESRTGISGLERRSLRVRFPLGVLSVVAMIALVLAGAGPVFILAKWAVSTTQDIIADPFGWWTHGIQWHNVSNAWSAVGIGRYLVHTLWVVLGSVGAGLFVSLTGAYTIAILRPRYAKVLNAAVLATLFVPGVISLIPLYLTILDVPLVGANLLNNYLAAWLPFGAHAFYMLIVIRFFQTLPAEVFEAAKVDGAGPVRTFVSIVLPMSRPVIAVVSLFMVVASWKDFLWPLLVLQAEPVRPLSVALAQLADKTEASVLMASMFIAVIVPVALFLVFQRHFLRSAGQAGAIKG